MNGARRVIALSLMMAVVACGPTLTRGPTGWHESGIPYAIAPLDDGALLPPGWGLRGYTVKDDGFRRNPDAVEGASFELIRSEDDGALYSSAYPIQDSDRAKLPEIFADRWITRVVRSPSIDDELVEDYAAVVPMRKLTAATTGWSTVRATTLVGRDVTVDRQSTFTVPGGDGVEITATLAPPGGSPDRRLYLAVVKQTSGERFVVVAYGNTTSAFDKGLPDATAFARRIRF